MARLQKSQLAKIILLVFFLTLLFLTPFISTSMRSSYLYFLLNLLIIVLGAEAGFLAAITQPCEEKKLDSIVIAPISADESVANSSATTCTDVIMQQVKPITVTSVEKNKVVNAGGVSNAAAKVQQGLKRCKSRPSLFFIGGCEPEEPEEVEMEEEEKEEEVVVVVQRSSVVGGDIGELSKQELFMKADMFIANFYKQLKMQRENSWQNLDGVYHKAF